MQLPKCYADPSNGKASATNTPLLLPRAFWRLGGRFLGHQCPLNGTNASELDIRALLLITSVFVSPLNGRALAWETRACFGMRAEEESGTTRGSAQKRFGVKKISAARFLLAMPSRKFARLLQLGGHGVKVSMGGD